MNGTYNVVMGDRGRLVIPMEVRDRLSLRPGTPLLLVETGGGVVLATRVQVKEWVRRGLEGPSLVTELVDERRRAAADDDVA